MRPNKLLKVILSFLFLIPSGWALASGPGLGNLTYNSNELFDPISIIDSPDGHGNAAMVDGYLMTIYSSDSGGGSNDGGVEFWDVSDPRNPSMVKRYDNGNTNGLREPHGFGFSNSYPQDVLVAQGIKGIQFWDVSDPANSLILLDYLNLTGINGGDYSGDWWVFFQAPYVYVAGTGSGLYIVDASDPSNPFVANHLSTSQTGSMNPGVVFALGNLLVMAENRGGKYTTMDISDPVNPVLLDTFNGKNGYAHIFANGQILTSGSDGSPNQMHVTNVTHGGQMSEVGSVGSGLGGGGYGSYQDGFFISGFSDRMAKFNIASMRQIGTGSSGLSGRDEDFGQVLGNIVFVGDDHNKGSALIPHQTAPDTNGADVHWVHPQDGANNQAMTSRIGVSMSDNVDLDSVDSTTFIVRPQGGTALAGKYSVQMGLLNFSPDQPLLPHTIYEVEVNGVKDYAGNAGGFHLSSFSTGVVVVSIAPPGIPASCSLESFGAAVTLATVNVDVGSVAGDEPIDYSWDFGDGNTTAATPTSLAGNAYADPGRYGVTLTVSNAFGSSSCSATQIVYSPLTAVEAVATSTIVHDGSSTYNVNPDNNTVAKIGSNDAKIWEQPAGANPRTIAVAPNGDLWVASQDDATIRILDFATGSETGHIALPRASRPYGVVFGPDSSAYVSLEGTGTLLRLSSAGAILDSLALGGSVRGIAIDGAATRIFVTRFVSPSNQGEVYEVDLGSFTLTRTIALANDPGPDTEASGRGIPNYLSNIRISPDGTRAHIPSKKDNMDRGQFRDGLNLTFESRTRTVVSQIDLGTNAEDLSSRIDLNDRDMAQAVLFSPLGDLFFVAVQGSNRVEVIDSNTLTVLTSLPTQFAPNGLAFNSDASKLYVHNYLSRSVTIWDTTDLIAGVNNNASLVGHVSTVASETLSVRVLNGKQIFYNAADPRMSQDGYISCASCHLEGGSDGQVWDFTQVGEGFRNTTTLKGRSGTGQGNVHWTANFDEIQDFENDMRFGFGGLGFLSNADFANTTDPLGNPKAGLSSDLDDMAAYVASLTSVPDSPHRNADGTLTASAEAGKRLFTRLDCQSCHSGANFTDGLRHDVGTIVANSGQGQDSALAGIGFDTPTLKGIWADPPYLHNGSAAALVDVLNSASHGGSDVLTATERQQLADYLAQIDEKEVPAAVVAASLPSSRSVQVGDLASAFATIINTSNTTATDCSIAPQTSVPADFAYQTTNASNVPVGTPNTPVDIPAGGSQSYVFAFTPVAPFSPVEVLLNYDCTNIDPAPVTAGLNTLFLTASATPVADIVALAITPTRDGILDLSGSNGSNAFSVATANVGSTDTITASAAAGSLPVFLSICETNDAGACLSAPASSTTSSVSAGATPTYSVFVTANGNVPFDPANNRIVVMFTDAGGAVRGLTSVAVRTL